MARDYQRFVMLSYGRTGSTYVMRQFDNRPDTVMLSELFHPNPDERAPAQGRCWEDGSNSWDFVCDNVYVDYPETVRAVGFKLFYFHARKGPEELAIWPGIAGDSAMKIVLLERENVFAGFVSEQRARATQVWHPRLGHEQYYAPVEIVVDPAAAEKYLQVNMNRRGWGTDFAKGHAVFRMSYEDMVADSTTTLRNMAGFLGLPAEDWLPAEFLKGSADRDMTRISNLGEVTAMLKRNGAEWMAEPYSG